MEELKQIVDMIASLPTMALWVLTGYWIYKLAIIGSVYATIRFCVAKFVDWKTTPPPPPHPVVYNFKGILVNEDVAIALAGQLTRLQTDSGYGYVHASDIARLTKGLDLLEAQEEAKEAAARRRV